MSPFEAKEKEKWGNKALLSAGKIRYPQEERKATEVMNGCIALFEKIITREGIVVPFVWFFRIFRAWFATLIRRKE